MKKLRKRVVALRVQEKAAGKLRSGRGIKLRKTAG